MGWRNQLQIFSIRPRGQGARQVGSTFKPFVYATAIEQLNMSPCDSIIDGPFMIHKGRHHVTENWEPKNSDNEYRGMVTLKKALANSINTVSAKLIDKVGPEAVVTLAHKLGIKSDIPAQPSIALGAVDITVQDMVAAYSTFANQGVYVKPQFITRIEDKNGVVLYEPIPESHDVLNKDIAFAVIKLLEGVTEEVREFGLEHKAAETATIAGQVIRMCLQTRLQEKQELHKINLMVGLWEWCRIWLLVFGLDAKTVRRVSKDLTYGQGATAALPIWGIFMKKNYADKTLLFLKENLKDQKT